MTEIEVGATRLPGVGWRYDLPLAGGTTILVVVEDSGRRHLVLAREAEDEPWFSVPLAEAQALAIAALLTGTRFSMVTHELTATERTPQTLVESVLVTERSAILGQLPRALAEQLGPHAELLGVVCDETPAILEDDPDRPLRVGDRVVVAARRAHRDEVRAALEA